LNFGGKYEIVARDRQIDIYVFPAWEENDVSHPYKIHG
jgi:hypothetical protein